MTHSPLGRWRVWLLGSTLILILAMGFGSLSFAAPPVEFKLGFKALADQIPNVVGEPLEEENWGANGDSLQRTSTGLMVWRKADNWTAFTNGSRTWINGPNGVQDRSNDERFAWEAPSPPAAGGPKIYYQANWADGLSGWTDADMRPVRPCWKIAGGQLISDGNPDCSSAYPPYQPGRANISDYAVEAEVRVDRWAANECFSLVARRDKPNDCGYYGALQLLRQSSNLYPHAGLLTVDVGNYLYDMAPYVALIPGSSPVTIQPGEWHKYRLEVKGNRIRWSIDNVVLAESFDDRRSTGGQAGVWVRCGTPQIAVRSFAIVEP